MKNKILWIVTMSPLLITSFVLPFMEDTIPVHYSGDQIDRWGSKYESFIMPGVILLCAVFWIIMIGNFKRKQKTEADENVVAKARENENILSYIAIGQIILFDIMQCVFLYSAIIETKNQMHVMAVDINVIMNILLGIAMIVFGNVMPKTKRNSILGIRTVWSLKNDFNWAKTNRFGGASLMIAGLLIALETAIVKGITSTYIMIGIIVLDTFVIVVYSYLMDKKKVLNT